MPSARTEVTEIVTGLAMLGLGDLDWALAARPATMHHVTDHHWDRLAGARADGAHEADFAGAWANGSAFLRARDGLRGRVPERIEWKGPHRAIDVADVPADLRVDRVYLVSCKYASKVLANLSPAGLFDRNLGLASGAGAGVGASAGERAADWFAAVAPRELDELYASARRVIGGDGLPPRVAELTAASRDRLKSALGRTLPEPVAAPYAALARAVGDRSARRWASALGDLADRERLLWRLLRFGAAPYFVLGSSGRSGGDSMRLRVDTPWDWRQQFRLRAFEVWPEPAGQPTVRWQASVTDHGTGADRSVRGHVEVRWSHGRFSGAPEAKVYLDTPHAEVPGYHKLV